MHGRIRERERERKEEVAMEILVAMSLGVRPSEGIKYLHGLKARDRIYIPGEDVKIPKGL